MTSRRMDERHDRAVDDSFPASDAPASTGITGTRAQHPAVTPTVRKSSPDRRGENSRPKGSPTDERHATETAYQDEDKERPRE